MQVHVRMRPRDPRESHRVSTPLELFLDLTFVVAVAQAASSLHHGLVEGHVGDALIGFPAVFFAIWWAWMNFSWFASAYDTDDVLYRLHVFAQMTGVLVLAAGVPRAFDEQDFAVLTVGYVIMRLAMVSQWLRAAASSTDGRRTAHRYAGAIVVLQIGWLLRLLLSEPLSLIVFLVLVAGELAVPWWSERAGQTPWHPHHMVERYGLFTIIVLGESVLSSTLAVQGALDDDSGLADLGTVIVGALLIVFSMWWIYFSLPTEGLVDRARADDGMTTSLSWGYGHYVIFASIAATGAGIAAAVDRATGHSQLSGSGTGLAVTVPVSLYVATTWLLHRGAKAPSARHNVLVPLVIVAVLLATFTPEPVLFSGLALVVFVTLTVV